MKRLLLIILLLVPAVVSAGEIKTTLEWGRIEKQMEEAIDRATADPPWKSLPQGEGSQLRIVRCTQGLYAVQESYRVVEWFDSRGLSGEVRTEWRNLKYASGCYTLEAARRIRDDEIDDRNRPPAPSVLYPVEVVE